MLLLMLIKMRLSVFPDDTFNPSEVCSRKIETIFAVQKAKEISAKKEEISCCLSVA
jgi:hypothetical protein